MGSDCISSWSLLIFLHYTESRDESDTDETEISLEPEFTATQIIADTCSFGEQLRDITNYPTASASSSSCQLDGSVNDSSYYPENDKSVSNDESGNSEVVKMATTEL